MYSVCPGWGNPADFRMDFEIGAVTRARASPARQARVAAAIHLVTDVAALVAG
jgi:hypothetical protein